MPAPIRRKVYCAGCLREHDDNGQRQTCSYCGVFPLPSYAYPVGSSFHPKHLGLEVPTKKPKPVSSHR